MVKPGKYKHYKGGTYVVLFTATDSETGKPVVVYMNELHGSYYTRTLDEFTSKVGELPRFKLIE